MSLIKLINPIFINCENFIFMSNSGIIFFTSDFVVCVEKLKKNFFLNVLNSYEKLEINNKEPTLRKLELYKEIRSIVNNGGDLYKITAFDFFDLEDANKNLYIYINIEDNLHLKQYLI